MFMLIVMACGYVNPNPMLVDSCALAFSPKPIKTEEVCLNLLTETVKRIPEPGYRVYANCIELGTPLPNL